MASSFESVQFLTSTSVISSLAVGGVVYGVQRLLNLDRRFISNCIVAAAATVPFAFMTAARSGVGADLLKEHGLWLVSIVLTLTVAGIIAVAQQAGSRDLDVLKLAERFMVNWFVGGVALVAYLGVWLAAWMMTGIMMLGSCC